MNDVPAAILDVLVSDCEERERDVPWMYRDNSEHGWVTTAVGKKLSSAMEASRLPFRMGDRPATAVEISLDYVRVLNMEPAHIAEYYRSAKSPMLPPGYGRDLCRTQIIGEFMPGLRRIFPNVDSFPVPAVRALLALSYALGVSGLAKFTHLVASCNRGDWLAASQECRMSTARPETNERNAGWLRASGQSTS